MYALLAIYVILKAMNLMISVTFLGRIVWTLSLLALVPLYGFLRSIRFSSLERKGLMWLIIILSGSMYVAGWVLNLTGHYPLGRILQIAGLDQFFLAIVLYVATFSLIDFLAIVANMYNSSGKMTTIRIDLIYRKLLNLVRFLAVSLWFYTFLVNINALEFLKDNVFNLLSTTFSVASFTFTPGGLLVFFIILYFSFYISGLMDGLFYDEKRTNETGGKTSLGSIVLMLRLFIIAVGFIMGLVIAGIPLNSLNLFVGALGVGIGFGLQSLIANMISGLVIAFEKPIYVGDIVEVDGIHGKVTDIGLRATKIDTFNGSEHIIPNSEFVSKTLKNWTFTSRHYRIESSFVVSHRHDPQTVLAMADEVIKSTGFVLRHPEPKVYIKQIEGSGVRFMISCWIGNISEANHLTSEILKRLHEKFDKAGITYPHDIRIDDNG
jgi:small-conductance mechanosensitive channel